MNTLEDKVRAALRETAGEITPRSVPPLRLHDARRPGPLGGVARRRWPTWLVPLAAAASVAIVIAASLAVSGVLRVRHPGTSTSGHQAGPFAGVPPYYLVLRGTNPSPTALQPQFALVKTTATGAVVARITAPKPYGTFVAVTAAADGRAFVLAASPWRVHHVDGGVDVPESPTKFFLLRLGPNGRPAHLTALPIAPLPGTAANIAVSPDGSKLAVAVRGGEAGGPSAAITVFNLATGSERVWTWPGGGPITNNAGGFGEVLSWTTDGRTLAFQQWVGNSIDIRLLDTTSPGGSLRSDSRLAVQWKDDAETFHFVHGKASNVIFGFSAIITGDGTKVVAATASETKHPLNSELAFTEFSASTGKVVKVLGRWPIPGLYPGQTQDVLWTDPSGSTLIVLAHVPGPPTKDPQSINSAGYRIEFGVLHGDRFTPLPGAPTPGPGSWPAW
jgi:hypothetical protein